jgi:hypothetical protein
MTAQSPHKLYVSELDMYLTTASALQLVDQENSDQLIFHNQNNNMEIEFRKFQTKGSLQSFLKKQLKDEALCPSGEFTECTIDGYDALTVKAGCLEMRQPVKLMLVCFKKNKEIHLIQFKCPEECYPEHCQEIEDFLSSIRFPSKEQSNLYLAHSIKIT